jgi:DNA-binding response OmpR family regulator
MRVLLIEDDRILGRLVERRLSRENMVVNWVQRLDDALTASRSLGYDLIILDRGLPDGDGIEAVDALRSSSRQPRVLVLTARGETVDRIAGLDAGADDYLVKPFDPDELAARCRALFRRSPTVEVGPITVANLCLHAEQRTVTVSGQNVVLPRRELLILECLVRNKGRVVPRERLVDETYAIDDEIESNGLEANISRLRKTLREAGCLAEIRVVRGVGYLIGVPTPKRHV